MRSICTLLYLFTTLFQVNANYVYDYSQKQKTGLVVRPFDLPKINLAALTKPRYVIKQIPPLLTHDPLKPSGDLCSCKTTVVSPALVPKPAVTGMGLRYDTTSKRFQAGYATGYAPQTAPGVVLPPSYPTASYPTAPAPVLPSNYPYATPFTANLDPVPVPSDPVSLQLALKAQREAVKTLEDKLSFGFRSMPIDGTIKKATTFKMQVPEENLLAVNGAVVALQPPREVQVQTNVDDEAEETLTKTQDVEVVAAGKKPTLGELGFAPANIVPPPTITLPAPAPSSVVHTAVPATYGVPGAPSLPCNEIYPGQVQTGTVPKREQYVLPPPSLPPCSEAEEAQAQAPAATSYPYAAAAPPAQQSSCCQ